MNQEKASTSIEQQSSVSPDQTVLERQVEKILSPFERFVHNQTTTSVLLFLCTVVALVIANSEFQVHYQALLHRHVGVYIGEHHAGLTLLHWVNEGLMSLFFFVLGLEIKREFLAGKLRDVRSAILVFMAAFGGMCMPALSYTVLNWSTESSVGWAIPTATDAAFALGALMLLGSRVPRGVLIFLTAFAIIDDIGAVVLIALFYSEQLSLHYLLLSASLLSVMALLNVAGVRHPTPYILIGALVWACFLNSGLHATLAGIAVAMTVPARPRRSKHTFAERIHQPLGQFEQKTDKHKPMLGDADGTEFVQSIYREAGQTITPLQHWESRLEAPIGLLVMPIFALANAGIALPSSPFSEILLSPVTAGIIIGLVVGKVLGITSMCWLGLRLGLGSLPEGMQFKHVAPVGLIAGMGFTMSIFVANLAFGGSEELIVQAKLGILLGSLVAMLGGIVWFLLIAGPRR